MDLYKMIMGSETNVQNASRAARQHMIILPLSSSHLTKKKKLLHFSSSFTGYWPALQASLDVATLPSLESYNQECFLWIELPLLVVGPPPSFQ